MRNLLKFTALLAIAVPAALSAVAATPSSGPTSTVVYVGGNDLVLKSSEGKVLNYMVPATYKFTAGTKQLTIADLKPGTKLTAPVATGSDPVLVASVAVVKAKVYGTAPPDSVTLMMPDGAKEFTVPAGSTFTIVGKATSVADLKPDTLIDATLITPAAEGEDPAPPATPAMSGTLLVAKSDGLPLAGTHLPLVGLIGLTLLLCGFGILRFRKPATL